MTLTLAEQHLKEHLFYLLKDLVLEITFNKSDGSKRVMRCTLQEDYLPQVLEEKDSEKITKKSSPETLVVWDLEKDDWRSFRVDSILEYRVVNIPEDLDGLVRKFTGHMRRINLKRMSENHADRLYFMAGQIESLEYVIEELKKYIKENS
jgi:hypothetical protein